MREVAVLRETSGARVIDIDGSRASSSAWALLPGDHEITLRVRLYTKVPNVDWKIWSYCRVRFDAQAGEEYESVVRVQKEVASGLSDKLKMEIGIADSSDRMRAHAYTCSGERPR